MGVGVCNVNGLFPERERDSQREREREWLVFMTVCACLWVHVCVLFNGSLFFPVYDCVALLY